MFFQISVTPKAKKTVEQIQEAPEPQAVLVLAPFQPQPRLKIESSVNVEAKTSLIIKNNSNRPLNVKVTKFPPCERSIILSTENLSIPPEDDSVLWLSWTPREAGSWRDTLQLTDNRRLKYDIPLTTLALDPKRTEKSSKSMKNGAHRVLAPVNDNYTCRRPVSPPPPRKQAPQLPANKENVSKKSNSEVSHLLKPKQENFMQNLEVSGVFDISSYQLTPLKAIPLKKEIKEEPATEFQFSPRDPRIISPAQESQAPLRRETYLNSDPKFCKLPTLAPLDNEPEENFDDSLSPRPSDEPQNPSNFSALIDNLANFVTPQKSAHLVPNPSVTVTKSREVFNSTFEINEIRQSESVSYGMTSSMMPTSSSPLPSIRTGDTATVKEVIEANLWIQEDPHFSRPKSSSFESIPEEISFRRQAPLLNIQETPSANPLGLFEISPTKRRARQRITQIRRISPRKPAKITKERLKKMLAKTPGVRITTLSLSKLQKPKPKEQSMKLYNPNLIFNISNPDPFAATMREDPFLASTLYYDEKWMYNQELSFKKWLNALLTPPEHLSADVDSHPVDVGKVWQSCRGKDVIPLAETREAVSARYHTNHRLNTLRKAALTMFQRAEVREVLGKTIVSVEKGNLNVRQDRDLHRDIGLQKEILELFFSYNPLWLRIGLEVVYGETIPLSSNNDLIGLTKFLISRFFSDPFLVEKYSHPNVSLKTADFTPHLNKFILKKFLLMVFFLDYAKRNQLIGHDPCLFHKKAVYKESREILLNFSRQTLSGVGDITKVLRPFGYVLSHKQTYLDEYDYAVKDLSVDLRDGVRLCRVMELMIGERNLTSRCRVPAISRLQKVHNAELALTALHGAGYIIAGEIDAKSVADGHREKTLSLLWQIIYKFQAPRFEKAAKVLQKWWKARLYYILVRNFLRRRRNNAAVVIQCCWRSFEARKIARNLKKQREQEWKRKNEAARRIQTWWRLLKERRRFLKMRSAAVALQRCWRRYSTSRPYLFELQRKREATLSIQRFFRSYRIMKIDRNNYLELVGASIIVQRWFRATLEGRRDLRNFTKLKQAVVSVQKRWRANKLMKQQRKLYLETLKSVEVIQNWWRGHLLMKRERNEFIIKREAVRIISSWYFNVRLLQTERKSFLEIRKSVIVVQKCWRRYRDTKHDVQYLKNVLKASVILQTWWRCAKTQKEYKKKKLGAIVIQKWYRNVKLTGQIRSSYLELRQSAILLQKTWKMKQQQRNYLKTKKSVSIIENSFLNWKQSKNMRNEFLALKNSVICIQKWWRSVKLMRQRQSEFLAAKKSAIVIQKAWRSLIFTRKIRADYVNLRKAVIYVQNVYRAKLLGRVARNEFLNLKKLAIFIQRSWRAKMMAREREEAAIVLQAWWRCVQLTRKCRESFENQKKAINTIKAWYRSCKLMGIARNDFEKYRSSAIIIQRCWRVYVLKKRRNELIEIRKKSVLMIEEWWKMILIRREMKKARAEKLKRTMNAAIIIQAKWRGHCVRKKQCERIKELRIRSQRAAESAAPSTTVAYRLQEAMNGLVNFSNIGQLTMCLACIDTLTRLSVKGCVVFCELDLVEKVYDLLEQSNRSLPWMDVCTRSTNILITLAKLPDTVHYVQRLDYMETVARLMNVTVKKHIELFLNLSTLLWILVLDDEFGEAVINDHKTTWLIRSACSIVLKGRGTPMKKKNNSMERIIVLPNTKLDWGLATKKPRCFIKVEHAVFALMEKFRISNL